MKVASTETSQSIRQRAEEKARLDGVTTSKPLAPDEAQKLLHELQVHQVELEMQNEELRRSQAELESARANYFDLYDLAPVGYLTIDEQGKILEANLTVATMVGALHGELINRRISRYISGEDRDVFYLYCQRLLQSGSADTCEVRMLKLSGSVFWANINGIAVQDITCGKTTYRIVINDITERKRAETEIREERAKLKAALESMNDAVFISDTEGRFIEFNEAFATFHKFKSKGECAKTLAEYPDILDVFITSNEPAPLEQWAVPRALRGEIGTNVEYGLRRKDTCESWVGSYSFAPIRNETGDIVGSVVSGRDITERKLAEQMILDTQQQIKKMAYELQIAEDNERSRIAAELHDQVGQRLLLGKMKLDALATLPSSDAIDGEIREITKLVDLSIQEIRTLTFQMRPPLLATLGLGPALRQLCIDLNEDYGLEIRFFDDNSPKPLTYEKNTAMYRCVRELLLNVAKHAGNKQAQLSIKREADTIVVTVIDKGVGFTPGTSTALSNRQCFGLFNVQQKLEYLGGSYMCTSEPDKGTHTTVTFPIDMITNNLGSKP